MPRLHRPLLLVPLAALASLFITSLACSQVGALTSTPTPTMPMVVCTAPACRPNKSYYCPGRCPGGCGTTCATDTPGPTPMSQCPPGAFYLPEGNTFKCMTPTPYVTDTPATLETPATVSCPPGELYLPANGALKCVTPTPWVPTPLAVTPEVPSGAPCLIVTRTPPPSAPTYAANSTDLPGQRVDPHVELCASARTLKVGESFTLVGQAVDIGLPYFYVMVRSAGAGDFRQLVVVTYNNEIKGQTDASESLELLSARGERNQLTLVLHARAPGAVELFINATGEVHYGYPGPAMWAGGSSDPLTLTVEK